MICNLYTSKAPNEPTKIFMRDGLVNKDDHIPYILRALQILQDFLEHWPTINISVHHLNQIAICDHICLT